MTIPQAGTAFLDRKYVPQELLTQRAAALSLQTENAFVRKSQGPHGQTLEGADEQSGDEMY